MNSIFLNVANIKELSDLDFDVNIFRFKPYAKDISYKTFQLGVRDLQQKLFEAISDFFIQPDFYAKVVKVITSQSRRNLPLDKQIELFNVKWTWERGSEKDLDLNDLQKILIISDSIKRNLEDNSFIVTSQKRFFSLNEPTIERVLLSEPIEYEGELLLYPWFKYSVSKIEIIFCLFLDRMHILMSTRTLRYEFEEITI